MTARTTETTRLMTGALVILAGLAVALVLRYTRSVTIPFVLALFISSLAMPLLDWQVLRLKFPRTLAYVLTVLVELAAIALLCLLAVKAMQMIIATVGQYSDSFAGLVQRILAQAKEWGYELDQEQVLQGLRGKLPGMVTNTFGTLMGFFSQFFLTAIFALFLLAGRNPHANLPESFTRVDNEIRRYIGTKVAISSVTGLLVWIVLRLCGLQLAGVFGILAFLLNFIPSIGSIIATFLPLPVALAQFDSLGMIVLVVVLPGAIQMAIGNVIEPKLMGKGLNLHPVTILLALSFWGLLWGVVGMFLAVPLTSVTRVILMQFDTLKPVGALMAGQLSSREQR